MKNRILFLLLCIIMVINLSAQTKSQVLVDIRFTLNDFMADLCIANENQSLNKNYIEDISETFGNSEYFIRNGQNTQSFQEWLDGYCKLKINSEPIQHTVIVLEQTLKKVDANNSEDKRYSVDVTLKRDRFVKGRMMNLPDERLTFTVV